MGIVLISGEMIAIQNYLSLKIKSFGIPVGLAIIIALGGFFLSVQNIFRPLAYLYPNGLWTLALNHDPFISFRLGEYGVMALAVTTLIGLCTFLSVKELKKK